MKYNGKKVVKVSSIGHGYVSAILEDGTCTSFPASLVKDSRSSLEKGSTYDKQEKAKRKNRDESNKRAVSRVKR